ncbi:MAG: Crp/Fnr family transcriptional regulator [Bdellovibrionales bacterium]|nr:Crp/Fnr family transcriptional regulator [Bdellovibrionales bacterium]
MAGGIKQLSKGEILFREGDPSDAMYVIKKGKIAITKAKGNSEIILAELMPGEMLGEMAFFDNKPRSAGAKATVDSEVISLPFAALHAQFKTFPEWLRAMVKTVNSHLRNANQTIKNLQQLNSNETEMFPPHTITCLCGIISLIGFKAGEQKEEGLVIPASMLRNYTIQIFKQPTYKMDRLMEELSKLGYMKVEELGEGRRKITILKHKDLSNFVDWYNEYLFKAEGKRITVEESELTCLKAILYYGNQKTKDDKGMVTISLTEMQNNSMKDLGQVVDVNAPDSLIAKGLLQDKQTLEGNITMAFNIDEVAKLTPFWTLVYHLLKIPPR